MNESIKKIQSLVKKFNDTFEIEANICEDENGETITDGLRIKGLNNDGVAFMNEIFDMFSTIVHASSDEYELVYDEQRGLAMAKKKITYEIED